MSNRFTHINIVSTDWRRLASFYENVLGCVPVYPERDLSGKRPDKVKELDGMLTDWLERVGAKMPRENPDYDPERKQKK